MTLPGFRAVISATLAPLQEHFLERVTEAPLPPLDTEIIFVQSLGMRQWLTRQLADRFGCAGSLAMPFPRDLLSHAARWAPVDLRGREHFTREALTWRLEAMLQTLDATDAVFAPITTYLGDGDPRMRAGLAIRVAGRFDDYQLFRPELLAAWDVGTLLTDNPHEAWQAALWRSLTGGPDAPHAARHLDLVLARLREARPGDLAVPTRITAFGISSLPPRYFDLLSALGRHSEVTLYAAVPPADSHPLERRLGHQGRALQELLVRQGVDITGVGEPPRIRAAVHAHVAHGAAREVEILHDQLLDAFAADPSLRPEDVLVLVPDVDHWGAIIETVFKTLRQGAQRIPFHIAHRSLRTDPAVRAFRDLLALEGGRLSHSEVFGVLQHPMVHAAAELDEARVEMLARRTQATNIRWGYDEASVTSLDLPSDDMPTWRQGLDRLLMGIVVGGRDETVLGVLPSAGATSGDPDALGALATWIDRVAALLREWKRPRTLAEWSTDLAEAAEQFLRGDDRDAKAARSRLLDQLRRMAADLPVEASAPIAFAVVRDWLEQEFAEDQGASRVVTGRVTVAGWKPMRSIPFRVIAVTGLDDATFPRRDRPVGFDLVAHAPMRGDRSLRDDDRQLFLDTAFAATDHLILSWTGKTASTAAERARSVVIDELVEVLQHEGQQLAIIEHPLHPFSPRYFSHAAEDAALFTYADQMERAAQAQAEPGERTGRDAFAPTPIDPRVLPASDEAIRLEDLIAFWENPAKWFCRESLRITLPEDESTEEDRERLSLSKMDVGLVRYLMLQGTLRGNVRPEAEQRRFIADGVLPPGKLGEAWYAKIAKDFGLLRPMFPATPTRTADISLRGDGWQVLGTIDGVTDGARYVLRSGAFHAKHRIRAWIEHVVVCAAAQAGHALPSTSRYIGLVKHYKTREQVATNTTVAEQPDALALVDHWVRLLRTARTRPLPVFPGAAAAWLDARNLKKTDAAIQMAKARAAYRGNGRVPGDDADAYAKLCFRDRDPFEHHADEFATLAASLLTSRPAKPFAAALPALK